MLRTLIAIPTMDTVPVRFLDSMIRMERPEGTEVVIVSNSLIYDARNRLADRAVKDGFDRLMWLDSDMAFDADLLLRLSADLDEGREMVCGLYFTRRQPCKPCIYSCLRNTTSTGRSIPWVIPYKGYPRDSVFEVAGCGFAAVMMTTDLIRKIREKFGPQPFWPMPGFGEDLSFCLRAKDTGAKIWCDSRIRVGHCGYHVFDEAVYDAQGE